MRIFPSIYRSQIFVKQPLPSIKELIDWKKEAQKDRVHQKIKLSLKRLKKFKKLKAEELEVNLNAEEMQAPTEQAKTGP